MCLLSVTTYSGTETSQSCKDGFSWPTCWCGLNGVQGFLVFAVCVLVGSSGSVGCEGTGKLWVNISLLLCCPDQLAQLSVCSCSNSIMDDGKSDILQNFCAITGKPGPCCPHQSSTADDSSGVTACMHACTEFWPTAAATSVHPQHVCGAGQLATAAEAHTKLCSCLCYLPP